MLGRDRPQSRGGNKRKLCIADCLNTMVGAFEEQVLDVENVARKMKRDNLPAAVIRHFGAAGKTLQQQATFGNQLPVTNDDCATHDPSGAPWKIQKRRHRLSA